jgi:hypothetical protein
MPVTVTGFARLGPDERTEILLRALLELVALELTLRFRGPFAAGALYAAGGRTRIGPDGQPEVRVLAGDES